MLNFLQTSRLKYTWATQSTDAPHEDSHTNSVLPILLHRFDKAGSQTVTVNVSNSVNSVELTANFVVSGKFRSFWVTVVKNHSRKILNKYSNHETKTALQIVILVIFT